jgi:hypothetical protein
VCTRKGDACEGPWEIHGVHQCFHPSQRGATYGTCTGAGSGGSGIWGERDLGGARLSLCVHGT